MSYSQLIDKGFDYRHFGRHETIVGTNAVDRITGLAGNDTLNGGAGNDTYLLNVGDGVDTSTICQRRLRVTAFGLAPVLPSVT